MSKEKKPLKEEVVNIDDSLVKYWHEGRMGMISLVTGKEPLTGKAIEKFIYFRDHFYTTSDAEEIKLLDEACGRNSSVIKRFDDYQLMVDATPKTIPMEINGKRVLVPMEALTDSFKEQLAKEEVDPSKPVFNRAKE